MSAEAPGEALYSVPGRLLSGDFSQPEGRYRSVLSWLSIGGGPFVECLESGSPELCAETPGYDTTLTVEPARVVPEFPSRFTLEVVSLPSLGRTLDYNGSVLAFGSVSVYDDRDDNGILDLAEDVGSELADRLVARSVLVGVPSVIVFREGPLHPGWKILRAFGCGDPPLGFSMVTNPTNFRCAVEPIAELVVSPVTAEATERDVCALEGSQLPAQLPTTPRWDIALHPQAVVDCDPSGESLSFYIDRGNLCDAYFETALALNGCQPDGGSDCVDRRDDPPHWWPCEIPQG